ncbi:MAG: PH domain-containing protein [Oscillospiraceae bacterium]
MKKEEQEKQMETLKNYEIKYVWKDRKRYFGLPISFTKYSISDDRLFLETGLLNTATEEILLYRVRDISLNVSLWQRIFRVGTVTVKSADKTRPILELQNVLHPQMVKELVHKQVENMKVSRRMRVGEIIEDDGCMHDDEDGLANEGESILDEGEE